MHSRESGEDGPVSMGLDHSATSVLSPDGLRVSVSGVDGMPIANKPSIPHTLGLSTPSTQLPTARGLHAPQPPLSIASFWARTDAR
jgi:hypothetical protein